MIRFAFEVAKDVEKPNRWVKLKMVVVHRAFGFRFVIYTLDHEPAHVHVTGAGHAKINLLGMNGQPELVFSTGIKRSDMKRLIDEVIRHRDAFLDMWERIHGRAD